MAVSFWLILGISLLLLGFPLTLYSWLGVFMLGAGCAFIAVSLVQMIWDTLPPTIDLIDEDR